MLIVFHSNCSPSLTKLGFIEPRALSDVEIIEIARGKFNIKNGNILKLDRAKFDTYLDSLNNDELSHDLYQPLQFRYYNKEGELEVLYANCYVPVEKRKVNMSGIGINKAHSILIHLLIQ